MEFSGSLYDFLMVVQSIFDIGESLWKLHEHESKRFPPSSVRQLTHVTVQA